VRFRDDILLNYMSSAPLALAFERYLESRILGQVPFRRPVLDLGCGDGLFAHLLFQEPIDTGIDPDPREIARARRRGCYRELIQGVGSAVPKPSGAYQTIFSNSVLEHIPLVEPVFREVLRLLAPGGRFYLTVPSPLFEQFTVLNTLLTGIGSERLAARYRRFCSRVLWRQQHYHTRAEWQSLAESHGFLPIEAFSYDPRILCLLNDSLYPLAGMSLLSRRFLDRWVLWPHLRRITLRPLSRIVEGFLERGLRAERGGLVFLALEKGVSP
jgi:SAM-dependent methyltransferase